MDRILIPCNLRFKPFSWSSWWADNMGKGQQIEAGDVGPSCLSCAVPTAFSISEIT